MHPPYQVLNLDLATARTKAPVIAVGPQITGVTVLGIPAGVLPFISMGSDGDDIPLLTQGQELRMCPPNSDGVFVTNTASAGILSLLIAYGDLDVNS